MVADRVGVEDWGSVFRRLPRGGVEECQFNSFLLVFDQVHLSSKRDMWEWSVDRDLGFSVASARKIIDAKLLEIGNVPTRWVALVPAKVNVFAWRLRLNRLPSLVNLDRRGVDLDSLLCPICGGDVETVNHLFFSCPMAMDLWSLLARWWGMDIPFMSTMEDWYIWVDNVKCRSVVKRCLAMVGLVTCWAIWCFRNKVLFNQDKPRKALIWEFIQSQSFLWITSRSSKSKFNISWVDWISFPYVIS